jgi:hypothetical protein
MKTRILHVGVFVTALGMTTLGVAATQYGGGQEKPKPDKSSAQQKSTAKPHTMTGCLEKGTEEGTFRLTNVEGTGPKTVELHADASKKLAAHVGHKIAITGPDVDPKTMKKGTTGKADPGATDTSGEHHMRVNSLKMIANSCS